VEGFTPPVSIEIGLVLSSVVVKIKITRRPEFLCLLGNRGDNKAVTKILDEILCVAEGDLKRLLLAASYNVFGITRQAHYGVKRTSVKSFTMVNWARNLFTHIVSFDRIVKYVICFHMLATTE
jgi:hypothetical protein